MQIIISEEEVQEVLANNGDFELKQGWFDSAYKKYIYPIISLEMINDVEDELKEEAEGLIKTAVINFALANNFFKIVLEIDSSSIKDNSAKEERATKEDKESLLQGLFADGYQAVEDLIIFLEENEEDFSDWKDSAKYTKLKSSFINSASLFQKYVDIGNSRQVFLKLWPSIQKVERKLKKLLPDGLYTKLLSKDDNIDDALLTKLLDDYLLPYIAHKALAEAIPSGAVMFRNDSIVAYDDTNTNKRTGYRTADRATLKEMQQQNEQDAQECLQDLLDLIEANKQGLGIVDQPQASTALVYESKPGSSLIFI